MIWRSGRSKARFSSRIFSFSITNKPQIHYLLAICASNRGVERMPSLTSAGPLNSIRIT
jgi:hypothetical protein